MADNEILSHIYSRKAVAKNTVYNLIGLVAPLIFAVFLIPFLINGLGTERFGILSIGWVIIGYFSLFDFGIGRALTKIVAEKIGLKKEQEIPDYFWTSLSIMVLFSLLGSIIIIVFTPFLLDNVFNVSKHLRTESSNVFYVLALAIPVVTTTAGIRGVLEAYQRFQIISVIRIGLGAFTFIGPSIVLVFTNHLFWVIISIVVFRLIILAVIMQQCIKVAPSLGTKRKFNLEILKPLIALSGWISISNIVAPIISYVDRFLIGALLSVTAVTYYSTPLEVVSRALVISGAIVGVLFPAFSANFINNKSYARELFIRGTKYIFIILFPITLFFLVFAKEILFIWLGKDFVQNSVHVFQFISIGILLNSLAQIPFSFIQGVGKPYIAAKLHLIELPLYLIVIYWGIINYGITGAAFAWLLRVSFDTVLLFLFSFRILEFRKNIIWQFFNFGLAALILNLVGYFVELFIIKAIFFAVVIIIFSLFSWFYFLDKTEKEYLIFQIKSILKNKNRLFVKSMKNG